ncbi:two-component sensor histidine kinase, partial [Streptomyces sp. NPDC056154]
MSSERARLTALYGGLLVLAGALLVGLVYLLVSEGLYASVLTAVAPAVPPRATAPALRSGMAPAPPRPASVRAQTVGQDPRP